MQRFENDLTSGSVVRQLIAFSVPFLLSNFMQALYNVADTLIVSWYAGPNSVSGVANGGQVTMLVMNFVIGLTVGGTVLIGQYYGAQQREDLRKTIGTMLTVLFGLAVLLTGVTIALSGPILRLIRIPEASFSEARSYLNICMGGTIFIFGYNAVSAILRGMGDSRHPLWFVAIACVTNIVLDVLLVRNFHMGASGAAIATVASQALSLALSILFLMRGSFIFDFKPSSFRIDREKMRLILRIGLPSSVQNVIVGLSFLVMTTLVNGYGLFASAAVGIVGKFNSFAILPAVAMSAAVSSMAAQNLGAGFPERALKTMRSGMFIVLPVGAVFFLLALLAPRMVLGVFTDDPQVIEMGASYIRTFSMDYLVVPFTFCANGMLTGAGHTTFTMVNGMLNSILLRVPIAILFGMVLNMGLTGIGLAAPVASLGGFVISAAYIYSGRWKRNGLGAIATVAGD